MLDESPIESLRRTFAPYTTTTRQPGVWDNEPDELEYKDKVTGYNCKMLRGPSGAWCGYVEVSKDHPLYDIDYTSEHPLLSDSPEGFFKVHGGITFSGLPRSTIKDGWWFGFDCSHCFDTTPMYNPENGVYRTVEYVKNEIATLCQQLKEIRLKGIRHAGIIKT